MATADQVMMVSVYGLEEEFQMSSETPSAKVVGIKNGYMEPKATTVTATTAMELAVKEMPSLPAAIVATATTSAPAAMPSGTHTQGLPKLS